MKKLGSPLVPFICLVCFISVQVLAQAQSKVCHTRAAHFQYKGNDRKWIGTDFFDENDSLLKSTGDFQTTNFFYRDAKGRLDSTIVSDDEGKTTKRYQYRGNQLMQISRTVNGKLQGHVDFYYNPLGDASATVVWGANKKITEETEYQYQYNDAREWVRKETFKIEKDEKKRIEVATRTFNGAGLLLSETVQAERGETTFEYTYNEANQLIGCWEKSGETWVERNYDPQGNLTFTKTYHLNRKGEQVYDFGVYHTYNQEGRLIGKETRDPKGHLKSREEWEYSPCP